LYLDGCFVLSFAQSLRVDQPRSIPEERNVEHVSRRTNDTGTPNHTTMIRDAYTHEFLAPRWYRTVRTQYRASCCNGETRQDFTAQKS